MNKFGTSQNTGSIPASRQAANTRPEGLADIGNGGDVTEGSGRSVTSAPMCRSERPSPDPVIAFEEYWGASKYRSRNMIGYSDKKCLAWEAFQAGTASVDERPEGRDGNRLGATPASAIGAAETPKDTVATPTPEITPEVGS